MIVENRHQENQCKQRKDRQQFPSVTAVVLPHKDFQDRKTYTSATCTLGKTSPSPCLNRKTTFYSIFWTRIDNIRAVIDEA